MRKEAFHSLVREMRSSSHQKREHSFVCSQGRVPHLFRFMIPRLKPPTLSLSKGIRCLFRCLLLTDSSSPEGAAAGCRMGIRKLRAYMNRCLKLLVSPVVKTPIIHPPLYIPPLRRIGHVEGTTFRARYQQAREISTVKLWAH